MGWPWRSYVACMPVDFLSDAEVARYGRYDGAPTRAEVEHVFFLDDEDKALVDRRRGEHMRLGFAIQLVTVRYLGCFRCRAAPTPWWSVKSPGTTTRPTGKRPPNA